MKDWKGDKVQILIKKQYQSKRKVRKLYQSSSKVGLILKVDFPLDILLDFPIFQHQHKLAEEKFV